MEKFRLRIQEEEERMTPIDAKPNNFHFRPKHQDHVAHKKGVSQLRRSDVDYTAIVAGSFSKSSNIIEEPPLSRFVYHRHHCRVFTTTATTVAFCQPLPPPSRFVNHRHYSCSSFHR
ncbi:unnamed protein product [Brassica rapa]|uniref:Uncharacterized protein n=2 Tax=Brassica TaxID=3705 RepID=A0A8D9H7K1_BRACM|nr:unnamed protein product [Brassica napus]CAG7893199.1 unnamed protein product [Brassica rapa]